jgi:hypothetical protein
MKTEEETLEALKREVMAALYRHCGITQSQIFNKNYRHHYALPADYHQQVFGSYFPKPKITCEILGEE